MREVSQNRRPFLSGHVPNRAAMRRLKESFLKIAEPCDRQPDVFYQIRSDEADTRIPYARPVLYALDCMASAKTDAQKRAVLEGVTRFAVEMVAICRAELPPLHVTLQEVVTKAQQADALEEIAESAYLAERTEANKDRWRDAIREQVITSEMLDMYLSVEGKQPASHPLRIAR